MARILIVDDQDFVRFTLKQVLERAGHEVTEASNGEDAIRQLDSVEPDLLITDILMPDKGGIEIITELKASHPRLKIVAMSGGGRIENMDYLELASATGGDATLLKPFRAQDVQDMLARTLG